MSGSATIKALDGWPGLIGIMLARLVLLIGLMFFLTWLLPGDNIAFYSFMALVYIISIPYALWSRNSKALARLVPLQFIVDLIVVTGVVYFTGGINSDLSLLYPLIILSAGVVSTPKHAIEITVLSIIAYVTLVVLLAQGVLIEYGTSGLQGNQIDVYRDVVLRIVVFACFGAVSAYISQRCHLMDKNLIRFREMAEIILRNVQAGLMLLDEDGNILMMNDRACSLLGREEDDLLGLPIDTVVGSGVVCTDTNCGDRGDAPCEFERMDGSRFPVSIEMSRLTMPAEIVPGKHKRKGNVVVCVTVFSDIGHIIEMKDKVERAERVRTAVDLAAEIAHEIRNPLAAVSGAAQQLDKLEKKAGEGDAGSAEMLLAERHRIYEIIVTESSRLDRTIERFINYTEYGPDAIEVKLDTGNGDDSETSKQT